MKVKRRLAFGFDAAPQLDLYTALANVIRQLDEMQSEISGGVRGHAHFNDLEERASAIGAELRAAFRNGKAR